MENKFRIAKLDPKYGEIWGNTDSHHKCEKQKDILTILEPF